MPTLLSCIFSCVLCIDLCYLLLQTSRALWGRCWHNYGTSEKCEGLREIPPQFAPPDLPVWLLRVFGERHHLWAARWVLYTIQHQLLRGNELNDDIFVPPHNLVYRQGDMGTSWYTVLSGSLDVKVSETSCHQVGGQKIKYQILSWKTRHVQ